MKLHEKIRKVRKEKGVSLRELQKKLAGIFGNKALRYNTLYRIEKGMREARVGSLSQIALGLGVSIKELKEGTEETVSVIGCVPKEGKGPQYVYSEKATGQILTTDKEPFLCLRLVLEPGGKTKIEEDHLVGNFQKFVYVLKGRITCEVDQERYTLTKDKSLCFDSHLPHHFENNTSRKAACIIFQNPKHIH
ncbi:MAG: helix-turn-helix domain-containing protein [Deltaproteobacteria bacterium]